MRKNITLFMLFLVVCFTIGTTLATIYIKKTISEFSYLVELHQIEDMRKNLVIRLQNVQSDLYTVRTPLASSLDAIVIHVTNLKNAAQECMECHHEEEVTDRINKINSLLMDYQDALSYYITASANAERIDRLKLEAAGIGNQLLFNTEEMSFDASRRLQFLTKVALQKVEKAKTILFSTIIITFFFGIVFALKLARSVTRPVNELVNATRIIASGDLGYKISLQDKAEFGELAKNFNIMSSALRDGYTKLQKEMSEREKIEGELIKAQKLESLGVLAGGIAHDFNNLLTGILGNIDLALHEMSDKETLSQLLREAEHASIRASDLTRQLLTFSKGGGPLKKPLILTDIIRESVSFALSGSNITAEYILSDKLWPILADEGQMNQVIYNLILNAREAMLEGGIVKVNAENLYKNSIANLSLKEDKYVKISVEDSGTGIPEENLTKIFDPYYSTKKMGPQKGMGLGLAICYSIIKNHDGLITVDSTIGVGTVFQVYLPASQATIAPGKIPEEIIYEGKGTILFMDDEEIVRNTAGKMLTNLGYVVSFAKDGTEAVEMYKKALELSQPFDAVIADLTVPGNMGGKEAVEKILKIDPSAKAIVSSGYSDNPIMTNFMEYGFSGVISKPFKITEFSKVLHQVIGRQSITFS